MVMPMDELKFPLSWPAAPRSGTIVVQHPAWENARNAVLDLAAKGPVTIFLTGEPGCGKTWLLRELATSLAGHGFPTMVLLRGDLPIPLSNGSAVLVDEASYMPEATRAELATQERGVVVLADLEPFSPTSTDGAPGPVPIHLRLLDPDEVGPFAAEWLHQEGTLSERLDPAGLSRLIAHGDGAVRLIAQLLTAGIVLTRTSGHSHLSGEVIDQVAAFRLGSFEIDRPPGSDRVVTPDPTLRPDTDAIVAQVEDPIEFPTSVNSPVLDPTVSVVQSLADWQPAKRRGYKWALAGTALAASVLAAVFLPGLMHRAPSVEVTARSELNLPPVQSAQVNGPDLVTASPPSITASGLTPTIDLPATSPSRVPSPSAPILANTSVPVPVETASSPTSAAALPPLQEATVSSPTLAAITAQPDLVPPLTAPATPAPAPDAMLAQAATPRALMPSAPPQVLAAMVEPTAPVINTASIAPVPAVAPQGASGLILVAQRGDTLERLYGDIYRDRHAPPFAEILAANPRPFKPGAIVVFPEPIGGWTRFAP